MVYSSLPLIPAPNDQFLIPSVLPSFPHELFDDPPPPPGQYPCILYSPARVRHDLLASVGDELVLNVSKEG